MEEWCTKAIKTQKDFVLLLITALSGNRTLVSMQWVLPNIWIPDHNNQNYGTAWIVTEAEGQAFFTTGNLRQTATPVACPWDQQWILSSFSSVWICFNLGQSHAYKLSLIPNLFESQNFLELKPHIIRLKRKKRFIVKFILSSNCQLFQIMWKEAPKYN